MEHVEVLLLALFVALYLFDSALLLHSNEALLLQAGGDRWLAGFGSSKLMLRGLELYLPNPLLPTRPIYRLSWQFEGAQSIRPSASQVVREKPQQALALLIWNHFWLSFIVLPLALFTQMGDMAVLFAFALIYANVVLIALALCWRRRALGLSLKDLASIVFEMAMCPPFALNLIRRLSLRVRVDEDFLHAARRLQQPGDWAHTRLQLQARLSQELEVEEADAPRAQLLRAQYEQLL
jgi:hypothetical protein